MSRRATLADLDRMERMARDYHETMQPAWPYSEAGFRQTVAHLIQSDDALVLVSDAGFFVGVKQRNPLSPDWITASELMWWGDAGLFRRFRAWAADADEIRYSCPPDARVSKFFGAFGNPAEIIYSEVPQCV